MDTTSNTMTINIKTPFRYVVTFFSNTDIAILRPYARVLLVCTSEAPSASCAALSLPGLFFF